MDVTSRQLKYNVAHDIGYTDTRRFPVDHVLFQKGQAISTDGRRLMIVEGDDAPDDPDVLLTVGTCQAAAKALSYEADRRRAGFPEPKAKVGRSGANNEVKFDGFHHWNPNPEGNLPWRDVMADASGALRGTFDMGLLIDLLTKMKGASTAEKPCVTVRFVCSDDGGPKIGGIIQTSGMSRLHLATAGVQGLMMAMDDADHPAWDDKLSQVNLVPVKAIEPGGMFYWDSTSERMVVVDPLERSQAEQVAGSVLAVSLKTGRLVSMPASATVTPLHIGGSSHA